MAATSTYSAMETRAVWELITYGGISMLSRTGEDERSSVAVFFYYSFACALSALIVRHIHFYGVCDYTAFLLSTRTLSPHPKPLPDHPPRTLSAVEGKQVTDPPE
jgi:hypothetical protein